MTQSDKMNRILAKQLAIDYCTDEESVLSKNNVFTYYSPSDGRRIFQEKECFLKVAIVNGKILASGEKEIIDWVREKYKDGNGAWFMDMECLHSLEAGLERKHRKHTEICLEAERRKDGIRRKCLKRY